MKKPYEQVLTHWRSAVPDSHHRSLTAYQILDSRYIQTADGQKLLNLASNDFMGLSHHPEVKQRAADWAQKYGSGAGASRLVSGTLAIHESVESKLADHKQMPAALIMGAGYQANASILSALLDGKTLGQQLHIYSDKLIHASMHAGLQLAQVKNGGKRGDWLIHRRFRHNDLRHLEKLLQQDKQACSGTFVPVILIESLYSMDGDGPDLTEIGMIADRYRAILYIDDAHSAGGYGPSGQGLPAAMGRHKPDFVMGTCSKAYGSYGSYILCSSLYRDYLINKAPGFIYSTAVPPALLGSLDAALDVIPTLDRERDHLHQISAELRDHCRALSLDFAGSISHIIPIILGSEQRMLHWAKTLYQAGYLVGAIRPPTVPEGSARLRISLSAALTSADLAGLKDQLSRLREMDP